MFGLLNTTQVYGVQTTHESNIATITNSNNSTTPNNCSRSNKSSKHYQSPRSTSSLSDSVRESKFFPSLSSMHAGIKSPSNFIEKFLKSDLLSSYDNLKNYKNFQNPNQGNNSNTNNNNINNNNSNNKHFVNNRNSYSEGILNNFNCLQGSYRSNSDGEFYEAVNVSNTTTQSKINPSEFNEMTIKCSKNLLAEPPQVQAPATLQNYQKLPDYEQHGYSLAASASTELVQQVPSSGASSGEFNSDLGGSSTHPPVAPQTTSTSGGGSNSSSSFYKRLAFGGNRSNANSVKHLDVTTQANESASDNSSSSITTTTTTNSCTSTTTTKSNDLHRSSSASSSGDCVTTSRERKCKSLNLQDLTPTNNPPTNNNNNNTNNNNNANVMLSPERVQRRKLIQMISNFEQQNKQLQRELIKEKRRRTDELSRVVKSLLCFESKLKSDMKTVNQRLAEKDNEICRLVRQNRALRRKLIELQQREKDKICDEGVVVGDVDDDDDGDGDVDGEMDDKISVKNREEDEDQLMEDCLVLEALQCINCRKQFYDIELKEGGTQTMGKDGCRKNADHHMMEHGSSSDDTVSSSFCGARRSVRYTSKRTSGTFRDYMRSRAMNIDDPALEQNSEENTSTISRDDSQTSYEKLNIYSRTMERMHGVKCESEKESSDHSGMEILSSLKNSSLSSRCSSRASDKIKEANAALEEDDGIFSPTQDDDFEEEQQSEPTMRSTNNRSLKIVQRRAPEFSEASPKQIYETSTDDWYASASDQEEIVGVRTAVTSKTSYGQGAVNPVLECVNQILLQQTMEDTVVLRERSSEQLHATPQRPQSLQVSPTNNLPRRSSLSGRRNSRSDPNDPQRNGTLTRKRVHFSTKNSMVHVPRNDELDEEDEETNEKDLQMKLIPALTEASHYHPMHGTFSTPILSNVIVTESTGGGEAFNYESIYSNEYEPVGSERNSSSLYVDMESATKLLEQKSAKKPPALPPKPANLMKFKKSLQQLDEMPDEQQDCDAATSVAPSEPDYCSISEVNVTNVQIVAVVHKPPESTVGDDELEAPVSELELEVSTVASDETCGALSQKTDEIEEIFADIPKLPNVAAIIAPKKQMKLQQNQQQQQQKQQQQQINSDYLIMTPKVEATNMKTQNARRLALNLNTSSGSLPHELLSTPIKSPKVEVVVSPFSLPLSIGSPTTPQHQQYKRKQMPNILAEINQRLSLPNTPTTPTKPLQTTPTQPSSGAMKAKQLPHIATDLPLQAEFDWYNLDAEYGGASSTATNGSKLNQPDLLKVNDHLSGNGMLAEIQEDHESVTAAADEYNLDEEFSLTSDQQQQPDVLSATSQEEQVEKETTKSEDETRQPPKMISKTILNPAAICEAINFPLYGENTPAVAPAKAKKMKKNLANFEKFIEGSGLSTKPLPTKRKIYFAGPYV